MTPVEAEIRRRIESEGPLPIARVMALANAHYYATRDPLGAGGDFITSPEISQIFGELMGLWAAMVWMGMGQPSPIRLVELGPGRGTLMADALRALKVVPSMRAAAHVHLVETSPVLRQAQKATLGDFGVPLAWHDRLDAVPEGPVIVLANEFFDALPVHHYERTNDGWRERVVGLAENGTLALGLTPYPVPEAVIPVLLRASPVGSIAETSPDSLAVMTRLAERLGKSGGAALIVDYGHVESAPGDTLQALRNHVFHPPLHDLGEADLTAHVDFRALCTAARAAGARVWRPKTQREVLLNLGLRERLEILCRSAQAADAAALRSGAERVIDPAVTGMGSLFKMMAVTSPALSAPPGFES
ncbi:class I SAM-dependent methyltransferase [Terrihabitans sp. B22-R8]|uniref:class I SAM-dependent methyltransferase n=1 Tax=Terrihabitans sp. B22-R8 TaxID=3425128 RepID=UPI00403CBE15